MSMQYNRSQLFVQGLAGSNLERAGLHNQQVTLQAIRVNAPVTKVEVANITGLTTPTISNITRRLVENGLIKEAGRDRGLRGKPAARWAINPDGAFSIGVNVDRDHLTMVVLDFLGEVRLRKTIEIPFASPEGFKAFLLSELDNIRQTELVAWDRIVGVGVAIPDDLGTIDLPQRPYDYGLWSNVELPAFLSDLLPAEIYVENDATAAAIGELQFGHGLRNKDFFYLLISAGLGGGLVVDGHSFRGTTGRSGEIGFLPIRSKKGASENIQDVVSLSGLYALFRENGLDINRVSQLATLDDAGQRLCDEWIERAAALLAEPFLTINAILNPDAIYIGGRLPNFLIDKLADRTSSKLRRIGAALPACGPVLRAALSEDAAAIGAAILPFSDKFLPSRSALMKVDN
jgi:predicted NBD/HSP70 family sugar kinase